MTHNNSWFILNFTPKNQKNPFLFTDEKDNHFKISEKLLACLKECNLKVDVKASYFVRY